jgi:hypothetical protein
LAQSNANREEVQKFIVSGNFEGAGQEEGCGNVTEVRECGEIPSTVAGSNAQPAIERAVRAVYPMVTGGRLSKG